MAKSKDRVRFHLPPRYFTGNQHSTNGMDRDICVEVLVRAFAVSESDVRGVMINHNQGFDILCRPSQFARFIVIRHEIGDCINGVRDLDPKIVCPCPDHLLVIANRSGQSIEDVAEIFRLASNEGFDVPEKLLAPREKPVALDVSDNMPWDNARRAC